MRSLTSFLLLSAFLSVFATQVNAQVVKLRADAISFKYKNDRTGRWGDWSDWEDVNILITIDPNKERIKIFSNKEQVYDIIENLGESYDDDGDKTWKFVCINEDGLRCHVRLVILYSDGGRKQLYVDFKDMMWVYNVNLIE